MVASAVPDGRATEAAGFYGVGAPGRQALPGAGRGAPGKACRPGGGRLRGLPRRHDGARSDGVRHDRAGDGTWRKASLIRNGEHTKARGWRGKESA